MPHVVYFVCMFGVWCACVVIAVAASAVFCHAGTDQRTDTLGGTPAPVSAAVRLKRTAPGSALDSARTAAIRDSLAAVHDSYRERFRAFPTHHDSLRSPRRLYSYQVQAADANGISEALRFAPLFVTIPYSLSSSLNRSLFMGYPTPRRYLEEPWYLVPPGPTAVRGGDWLFAGNILEVTADPGGPLRFEHRPLPSIAPITFIMWENGVFDENSLHVLFGRPLSGSVAIGVSSDYRSFRGKSYSHNPGNVYGSYRQIVDDTSLIVNRGYNPGVDEHIVSLRVEYRGRFHALASHTYLDLHNQKAYGRDSSRVRWEMMHQYGHQTAIAVDSARIGRLAARGALLYTHDVEREDRALDERGAYRLARRGEQNALAAGVAGTMRPAGDDTLALEARARVAWKDFYHEREWTISHTRVTLDYSRMFGDSALGLTVSGGTGHVIETVNRKTGNTWTWRVRARGFFANQDISLYARRDVLPYDPPLDPALTFPGRIPDAAELYGADIRLHWSRLAFYTAYAYSVGVDSASLLHAWPDAAVPYAEPRHTVILAPSVGRFAGFSLYARYLLADARPYHKLQTGLAWEWQSSDKNQVIRFELAADWWSPREQVRYAGIDTWHRTIFDLYGKGAVEIKSFRLFYKVDNILNRKIAYVPGHFMPGLTFRWGFNWFFGR